MRDEVLEWRSRGTFEVFVRTLDGRQLHMYPATPSTFAAWIEELLEKGLLPLSTLGHSPRLTLEQR